MKGLSSRGRQELERFFLIGKAAVFQPGEVLLSPDEAAGKVFFLSRGAVKAYFLSENGAMVSLGLFRPGDVFPLEELFDDGGDHSYLEAVTRTEARVIAGEELIVFLKQCPAALSYLLSLLSCRLVELTARLEPALSCPSGGRLARLLYLFARQLGAPNGEIAYPAALTHQELASWLGMTRETVSLQMEVLRRKGLIAYSGGKIKIKSLSRLRDFSPV